MLFPSIFDDMAFDRSDEKLMKTDIVKGENETKLVIDVPGFTKEDIAIELKNGYLTVSATKNEENKKEEEGKLVYQERSTRSCSRSFEVGNKLTEDDIDASLDNGVLTVKVKNMTPNTESRRIEIK